MRGINKILLENILPAHVAETFLLRVQGVAGFLQQDSNVSFICQEIHTATVMVYDSGW